MRQLFLFAFLLFAATAFAQQTQYFGAPNTTIDTRGPFAFAVKDTTFTPTRTGVVVLRPADTALYYSIATSGHKWQRVGTGSGSGLSITDTLSADSVWVKGYISGGNLYRISISGDTALVGSTGGGATPSLQAVTDVGDTTNHTLKLQDPDGNITIKIDPGDGDGQGSVQFFGNASAPGASGIWNASQWRYSLGGNTKTFGVGTTTTSSAITLPDASGTLALQAADSLNTPMNMLWQDAVGNLHKAAVPGGGGGSQDIQSVVDHGYTMSSGNLYFKVPYTANVGFLVGDTTSLDAEAHLNITGGGWTLYAQSDYSNSTAVTSNATKFDVAIADVNGSAQSRSATWRQTGDGVMKRLMTTYAGASSTDTVAYLSDVRAASGGGSYLPLAGGTLSGAVDFGTGIVHTIGGGQKFFANGSNKHFIYTGTAGIQFTNQANTTAIGTMSNAGDFSMVGTVTGSNLSGTNTGDETTTRINALYGYTPANGANYLPLSGGTMTGAIAFTPQATPSAPASGFKLYSESSGGSLSWITNAGYVRTLRVRNQSQDLTAYFQNKPSYTIGDSADIATNAANIATNTANIATNTAAIAGKQATLVSGTNIKTINGSSLLGSGNLSVGNTLYLGSYSKTARDAISSPATGSQIFQTDDGWYEYYDSFWGWMPMAITNDWKRKYGIDEFSDFINPNNGTPLSSFSANSGAFSSNSNPGSTAENSTTSTLALNSTTNARAGWHCSPVSTDFSLFLGGGTTVYEAKVTIQTLSTSTDRFQVLAGLFDVTSAVDQTDGVYFLYDEGGVSTGSAASGNWQLVTSSNGVRSFSTTSSTVAAATWYKLRVEVNAAGTNATFYINGTNVGSITTNIPVGTSRTTAYGLYGQKSAGTTGRNISVDYISFKQKFTTSR